MALIDRVTHVINLEEKLRQFSGHGSPRIVASFNGKDVMVVKVKGRFVWHSHPDTDDLSYVLKGHLTTQLRGGNVHLGPGDLSVVPREVQHRPLAEEEVHLLLIEPTDTPSTGDVTTAALKEVI